MSVKRKFFLRRVSVSQYYPLTWIYFSRHTNNRLNQQHERALGIICSDYKLRFAESLEKDGSFTIYYSRIHTLRISYTDYIPRSQ